MHNYNKPFGVLLGLACGDALGRPIEFLSSGEITHKYGTITDMLGNGTYGKPSGTLTDDTEMALCIARSLVNAKKFVPKDIAQRFVEWYEREPFDIGVMTSRSLRLIQQGVSWKNAARQVWKESNEGHNAGNGSVMRCAPIALAFKEDSTSLQAASRISSKITHADPRCTYGAALLNLTIAALLRGKREPLHTALTQVNGEPPSELVAALQKVPHDLKLQHLHTSGYVVHTLQTALFCALTADNATEAIINAVNLGGDTDTIGAVTGAIAGAKFGASDLSNRWKEEVEKREEIKNLTISLSKINPAFKALKEYFV